MFASTICEGDPLPPGRWYPVATGVAGSKGGFSPWGGGRRGRGGCRSCEGWIHRREGWIRRRE
eukprot:293947-Prorocentrum_minimum.AAC.1